MGVHAMNGDEWFSTFHPNCRHSFIPSVEAFQYGDAVVRIDGVVCPVTDFEMTIDPNGSTTVELNVDPRAAVRSFKRLEALTDVIARPALTRAVERLTARETVIRKALGEFE